MRVVRKGSRLFAAAAVTLGLGVAGVATAGPAAAATVNAKCTMSGFSTVIPWTWNPKVTFSPSSAKVGDSVKVTVTLPEGYANGPAVAVKADQLTPFVYLSIGGTEVVTKGTTATAIAPPNAPIKFNSMSGTYKASKAGDQKVTMTKAYFDYLGSKSKIDTTCTPTSKPTLATLTVSSSSSNSGGNNNSGNNSGNNNSGNTNTNAGSNTNTNTGSNNSSGANTNNNANKGNNKSGGKSDLAKTGAGDAWVTAVVAAVALQLGLIAYVRARRRPVTIRRSL